MKLKTGTKISLLFTLFTFFIILFLLIVINVSTFFNWYNTEKSEIISKLDKEYNEVITESNDINIQREKLNDELEEKDWFIGENTKYKNIFFNIYIFEKGYFIIISKETKFGIINFTYNIDNYIKNQLDLLLISIFSLLIFVIFSFFISKYLFLRFALKDIFLITNKLKNINLEDIKKFDINFDKNDEIYEIISSINKFLDLINENTKSLKEFNTNVSHEFKTPLMIISTQLEYAIKTKKYDESFEKIEKQIDFLNELLEIFLFISKIQNSKINIKPKKVNVSKLITNLLDEIEKIYSLKNIKLIKNIDKNIYLETDEKLFFLVVKNLIDNSFKYTNNEGKIEIFLNEKSFKIIDNGIGISKNKLDNVFNNFYRESDDDKGYGIGLNVVKKIIDLLNYKISIKSKKGFGSEFEIIFH